MLCNLSPVQMGKLFAWEFVLLDFTFLL